MTHRNCWMNLLQSSLIILLISGSVIFIFEPEIKQQFHLWHLHQKKKTFKILLLMNDISENFIPNATSIRVYNTLCTLGLAEGIAYAFSDTRFPYKFVVYETDKQEELNKTYLDSFDLIVVGGITYWWIYASDSEKKALIQTETPILTSANLGLNSTPDLNNLVGVYHASKNDYEAWRSVLPINLTKIVYTNITQELLRSHPLTSNKMIYLIDVTPTANARIFAYALRDEKQYPYIVFNGTKNFYINTYTYKGIKQVYGDILVILDVIFDLFTEEYLAFKIGHISTLRIIANTLIIPIAIFISCITGCRAVKLEYREKIKIRVEINKLKKAIFLNGLLLIFIVLIAFSLKTYMTHISFERYISIEYLVGTTCFFIAIISAYASPNSCQRSKKRGGRLRLTCYEVSKF